MCFIFLLPFGVKAVYVCDNYVHSSILGVVGALILIMQCAFAEKSYLFLRCVFPSVV
jgi:hypothetical protein